MLEIYSTNAVQTLGAANAESVVPFTNQHIQKGSATTQAGNGANVNCCGAYNVNVGISFSPSAAADITFSLYVDNVKQPQAVRTVTGATIDDYYTVDFSTYVQKRGNNNPNCPCTAPTNIYVTASASVADVALTYVTTDMQVYKA